MSSCRILFVFFALAFAVVARAGVPVFEQVLVVTNSSLASGEIRLLSFNDDRDLLISMLQTGWKTKLIRNGLSIELPSAADPGSPWFTANNMSQRAADGSVYVCGLAANADKFYPALWKVTASGEVTMTPLPSQGTLPLDGFVPHAVNSAGVVVGQTTNSMEQSIEYRPPYTNYVQTAHGGPLGLLNNGARITPFEMYSADEANGMSGAWTSAEGVAIRIPPIPNGSSFGILPLALCGDWVVGSAPLTPRRRAFAWQQNLRRSIDLPDPPNLPYHPSSVALSVNAGGDTVGLLGVLYPPDINGDLVFWQRQETGYVAHLFQSLLAPSSGVPRTSQAFINNRGDVAVLWSGYPDGAAVRVYARVLDGFVGLVTQGPLSVSEEDGAANFTVDFVRALENTNVVIVSYETVGPSAANYRPIHGTLMWQPGESGQKIISVPLVDNVTVDPNTTFELRLSDVEGARFGPQTNLQCFVSERFQRVNFINGVEIEPGYNVVPVRPGAKSAVVVVERASGNDGELALTGIDAWLSTQGQDTSWAPGEWGRRRIVVPLDDVQSASDEVQYKIVHGIVNLDGNYNYVYWEFRASVAIVPAGIVPSLSINEFRLSSDTSSLSLTANTVQGSVVELLGCDTADGSWRAVGEQPDVDGIASFTVPILSGASQRFFSVRIKK